MLTASSNQGHGTITEVENFRPASIKNSLTAMLTECDIPISSHLIKDSFSFESDCEKETLRKEIEIKKE